MSNFKIKKFKVSNFSITLQIILINLFVILISFILFGFLNFYSISRNLNIEDKSNQLSSLSNNLVKSIVNNAIKVPLYSTSEEVFVQNNKEELEPYAISVIVEVYKDIDSEIKVYDPKLNLIVNSENFSRGQVKEVNISESKNFYEKLNIYFSKKFVNFWYLYNKNKFSNILVPQFNETIKITEVIKNNKPLKLYYTDEKNSILIKVISPLLKNNDIYGVVVLTGQLSNAESIIANLSSNLFDNLLVTMFIVILLSVFFARSIANPIKKLSAITNQYKIHNNLNKLKQNFPKRADEIGQLSENIEEMSKELFQKIAELEKFAADVAHELKNPLTSIKYANEILQKKDNNNKEKSKLNLIIDKDTTKMNKLISDISNYTRIKAKIDKLTDEKINIKEFLEEIVENYRENRKNIKINLRMDEGNFIILGNYEKLAQLFSNVIDNAISFTPKNKSIFIFFKKDENFGLISIMDQGIGINYQYKEKIFDRFYTDRINDDDMHSGLGLDIAKNIVESYKGSIYLDNKIIKGYEGACFVIKLPIKEA